MPNLLSTCGFAAALLFGPAVTAPAQALTDYPVLNYRVFALRPSPTSRTAVYYGSNKQAVLRALGQPTKTTRYHYEMDRKWATVLHYGPNQLFFVDDVLDMAELHDSRWTIGQPGAFTFRVGSVLSHRPNQPPVFGTFQLNTKPGRTRNLDYSTISVGGFKDGKVVFDESGYEILFDQQGRVTHIFFGG